MSLKINENQVSLKLKNVCDSVSQMQCHYIANALATGNFKSKTVLVLYILAYFVLNYGTACEEALNKYKKNMGSEINDANVSGNRYLNAKAKLLMPEFTHENDFMRSILESFPKNLQGINDCVSIDLKLNEAYFNKTPKNYIDEILNKLIEGDKLCFQFKYSIDDVSGNKKVVSKKDCIFKGVAEYVALVSGVITKGLPNIVKAIKSMIPSSAEIRLQSARRSVKSLANGAGSALSTAASKVGHPIKKYAEKAGSNLTSAADSVGDSIKSVGHSVHRAASGVGDNAKNLGLTVTRRARDAAHNISSKAKFSAANIRYMGVADSKNWSKETTLSSAQLSLLKKFIENDLLACLNVSKSFEQKVESMITLSKSSPFFGEKKILEDMHKRLSTFGPHSLLVGLKETILTCVNKLRLSPYFLSHLMNDSSMILSACFPIRSCASTMCTSIHALAEGIDKVRRAIANSPTYASSAKGSLKPFIAENINKFNPSLEKLNTSFRDFGQFFGDFKNLDFNSKICTLKSFCQDKPLDILLKQIDSSITVEGLYNWLSNIYVTISAYERSISGEAEKFKKTASSGLPFHKQLGDFLLALYNAKF